MTVDTTINDKTVKDTINNDHKEYSNNDNDSDNSEQEYILPSLDELELILLDESLPIGKRTRCIFLLKQIDTHDSIDVLIKGLSSPSVLLAHEIAYVLGQMNDKYAIPALVNTLNNKRIDPIVRHECVEALGNIGDQTTIELLNDIMNDSNECNEVIDTCKISIDKLKYNIEYKKNAFKMLQQKSNSSIGAVSIYSSVDPAPPYTDITDIQELKTILCNRENSLFERYRAMFTLRNIGSDESIHALVSGFDSEPIDSGSAVFRHEIAYVLGQLSNPLATDALSRILQQHSEHAMTRHEAAEALGAISGDGHNTDQIDSLLRQYTNDKDTVVKESCDVALDISEYWRSDQFDTAV